MDLREIGCEDGKWMELAQDRVPWLDFALGVLNIRKLYKIPNSSTCCCRHATSGADRSVLYHSRRVSGDKTHTSATASADIERRLRPETDGGSGQVQHRPKCYNLTRPDPIFTFKHNRPSPSFPALPTEQNQISVQSE